MTAPEIKGFIPSTMLDWEGMLASTLFLPRCNFRCPFCQNPDLVLNPSVLQTVPLGVVLDFLADRRGWVDGVCITGGEPCLHEGLADLCASLRGAGVKVKLDTNGSLPGALSGLLSEELVDYVAMDVKAPLEPGPYRAATGVDDSGVLDSVRESIRVLRASGIGREFRTTVVPLLHGPSEISSIAESLAGEERYVLQYFSPRDTLDPRYSSLRPFTEDDMEEMLDAARGFIPGTLVRGAPEGVDQA